MKFITDKQPLMHMVKQMITLKNLIQKRKEISPIHSKPNKSEINENDENSDDWMNDDNDDTLAKVIDPSLSTEVFI